MTEEYTKKVLVEYSKSKDYRIVAATGAWGGLSPQGEIICNLFVEQTVQPEKIEITLDAQGKVVDESIINRSKLFHYTRELQIGVVMRPDIAKTIGQWLIDQSDKISPLSDSNKSIITPAIKHDP
jgi:hypothetical protein